LLVCKRYKRSVIESDVLERLGNLAAQQHQYLPGRVRIKQLKRTLPCLRSRPVPHTEIRAVERKILGLWEPKNVPQPVPGAAWRVAVEGELRVVRDRVVFADE
jgi:hypothetical protein